MKNPNFKSSILKGISSNEVEIVKADDAVSIAIISLLTIFILFVDSIFILLSIFKKGLVKKEVLSDRSNLGFDIDIIVKP